jgi:uncharacterized protein YbdZ (MbtH family)/predicted MFS family arabinose efflux permease
VSAGAGPGGDLPIPTPLSRNRSFRLLWSSQAMSTFGSSASAIAFPLLVLAVTGSAAASGLVLGTMAGAQLLAGLPAGALVDRWNRKRIMVGCEAAHGAAAASMVAALSAGVVSVPHLVAVAAVIGVCAALFEPAEEASLGRVVPPEQLSTAMAFNTARDSLGHLAGTAAGGFLFAVGRLVPFAVDMLSHAAALLALLFVRIPPRAEESQAPAHLGREIAAGVRWVWGHRPIRVTALCAVLLNLFFNAFYIVVIVLAESRGMPPAEIGVMAAMLGAGGILGALLAPYLHRLMSPYASIAAVFWVLAALTPFAAVADSGYVIGALFAAMALLPPTANTAIMSQQLLLTPDDLRGRLSAVIGLATGVAATLGPVLGGLLTGVLSGQHAVLLCAAGIAVAAVAVTISPTLRRFPWQGAAGRRHSANSQSTQNSGGQPMDDENARYQVLRNDEDQYSLWPLGHEVPQGWYPVGKEGTREECSAHVDEVWTDMRPRSLRERMDGTA